MQTFWNRFIRHAIVVGISLALVGYLLGKSFLMVHRMYSGGAYNPENERVLWQTPITMAIFGIVMTAVIDLLAGVFRRKAPVISGTSPSDSVQ